MLLFLFSFLFFFRCCLLFAACKLLSTCYTGNVPASQGIIKYASQRGQKGEYVMKKTTKKATEEMVYIMNPINKELMQVPANQAAEILQQLTDQLVTKKSTMWVSDIAKKGLEKHISSKYGRPDHVKYELIGAFQRDISNAVIMVWKETEIETGNVIISINRYGEKMGIPLAVKNLTIKECQQLQELLAKTVKEGNK